MNILAIKIIIMALLVVGVFGGAYLHFKHDRENQAALGAANERIAQLEASLASRDADVASLNQRIRERNQQALDDIATAEKAQAQARIEADKAKADKKQADLRLAEAQRKYREILNANENVRNYSNAVIPDAVLERLRSANGEADDDTVRARPSNRGAIQADPGRLAAWLQMPLPAR